MGKPKIYFIKPETGWKWVDSVAKFFALDPILGICKDHGYDVVNKDGCTVQEYNQILEKPDTHGAVIAGAHGDIMGIQLDPDPSRPFNQGRTETLRSWDDSNKPTQSITKRPNANLKFVVFHACNIGRSTLRDYKARLNTTAKQAEVYGWPGKDQYSISGLPQTLYQICQGLPDRNVPFTPTDTGPRQPSDAGLGGPKDAIPAGGIGPRTTPTTRIFSPGTVASTRDISKIQADRDTGQFVKHTIRYGDRVWNLADNYGYGNRQQFVDDVWKLNPGIDFTRLMPGQVIRFPSKLRTPRISAFNASSQEVISPPIVSQKWMDQGLIERSHLGSLTSPRPQYATSQPSILQTLSQRLGKDYTPPYREPTFSVMETLNRLEREGIERERTQQWLRNIQQQLDRRPYSATSPPSALAQAARGLTGPYGFSSRTSLRPQYAASQMGSLSSYAMGLTKPSHFNSQTSLRPQYAASQMGSLASYSRGLG
jgi:hypothetical protein